MSKSACYCGHPRFYDYRHQSGDCPCQTRGSRSGDAPLPELLTVPNRTRGAAAGRLVG